jgi:hypothetical protein
MWVNGRQKGSHPSKHKTYRHGGPIILGTKGRSDLPKFKGMLDNVRLYNRALDTKEVNGRFLAEASEHSFDPEWFNRVTVRPYYYLDRNEIVVEADYKWLQPLQGRGTLEVTLAEGKNPDEIIERVVLDPVPAGWGVADVTLTFSQLADENMFWPPRSRTATARTPWRKFIFRIRPSPYCFRCLRKRRPAPFGRRRSPTRSNSRWAIRAVSSSPSTTASIRSTPESPGLMVNSISSVQAAADPRGEAS